MSSSWNHFDRDLIRRALAQAASSDAAPGVRRAAVSLIIREADDDAELLLIRRAERAGDPWSGHMALPGGHESPHDSDLFATSLRETREEIGVDLATMAELLGQLDDLVPSRTVSVVVRPFVFAVNQAPTLTINAEVAHAEWVSLSALASDALRFEYEVTHEGRSFRLPAFRVSGQPVWGLTYRVLTAFIARVARAANGTRLDLEREP